MLDRSRPVQSSLAPSQMKGMHSTNRSLFLVVCHETKDIRGGSTSPELTKGW